MDRERFESLVARAVEDLPDEFRDRLDNIDIVVDDRHTAGQLKTVGLAGGQTLLGLYEGVPRTKRDIYYGMVPPDKITIFQKPVEAKCRNEDAIVGEVQRVVKHEIAHHFGLSDARLDEIEKGQD
ncbi:MAG: metallopeptidase family protein [Chloroflexota bacterium]|nr:metallopeptidase family protein [Chloroflexota bacterium]